MFSLKLSGAAVLCALMFPVAATATTVTFEQATLTGASTIVGDGLSATTDGVTVTATAQTNTGSANDARVRVFGTTQDNAGWTIGGALFPNTQFNGATNASDGTYGLGFSQSVSSVTVSFAFLTNRVGDTVDPPEMISEFFADTLALTQSDISLVSNAASFVGGAIVANDNVGDARGTFTYSGGAFDALFFRHTQNPGLLGFTITQIEATLATPVPLPAGLPLLLAGLGGFAVLRRRRKLA